MTFETSPHSMSGLRLERGRRHRTLSQLVRLLRGAGVRALHGLLVLSLLAPSLSGVAEAHPGSGSSSQADPTATAEPTTSPAERSTPEPTVTPTDFLTAEPTREPGLPTEAPPEESTTGGRVFLPVILQGATDVSGPLSHLQVHGRITLAQRRTVGR